jgi:hypothetical protein
MSKTKIVIALVALAALALVAVGLVSAQAINQTVPSTAPNTAANGGFLGWIGQCFGFRTNQQYYGSTPYIAPQVPPINSSAPAPYAPYQGNNGYGYGYGYGPCMGRFLP